MRQIGGPKVWIFLVAVAVTVLLSGCTGGTDLKTHKLTVTVLHAELETPLSGVLVEVVGKGLSAKETNTAGQVSFSGLSGSVEIMVRSTGFVSKGQTVVMDREQSVTIALAPEPDNSEPKEVAGPKFATVSKRDGRYFRFESGEASAEAEGADLKLTWVQNGNEYSMIGFENINGVRFSVNHDLASEDIALVLGRFRTVTESDWEPSEPDETICLNPHDTLILKTNTNRLVKLFILEMRGHWQHDDAAAVDFAYLFMDEVDLSPPVIESVTLVTASKEEITKPVQAGVIEFETAGDPELIYFTLNEVVFGNRPLALQHKEAFHPSKLYFYPSSGYLGSPLFSTEFGAGISVYGMKPPWSEIELAAGDAAFYEDFQGDQGHFFSDLLGNQLTELPFDRILIKSLEN